MKKYIFNGDLDQQERQDFDAIIIGSGIAGLYTALNIDPNLRCVVLSKAAIEKSSSWLAQGGIAAVIAEDDRIESHFEDTMNAGAGLCDEAAVKLLVNEGPKDIQQLMKMKVPFDLDEDGFLHITREGGHTKNRILHCGGDATGRETVKTLAAIAAARPNIILKENVFITDILTYENRVSGLLVLEKGQFKLLASKNIVMSTGGIGQVYRYTTNPLSATGDGVAAAVRAGAHIKNMEFVQFHPTALYSSDGGEQAFLISEAVRGEGGVLRNIEGTAFMEGQHPMKDLAPRDIVTRIIAQEMIKTSAQHVYLDITSKPRTYLSKRFPTIFNKCLEYDLDISKDWIPVCPVQHYLMGGLETDINGMTNIFGLYASGEAACTGVHGANRLASNSLLECLVFGRRCAEHINKKMNDGTSIKHFDYVRKDSLKNVSIDHIKIRECIKSIMTKKGGIIRETVMLEEGIKEMEKLLDALEGIELDKRETIETFNMAMVSMEILRAALDREESIGAHYRI